MAKLATRLGVAISPDILLRHIRHAPEPQVPTPGVPGADDWAWKKGYRQGTILLDLERRRAVDPLPNRFP